MDPLRDAKIGPTAHYTAYVWKRLGLPHADLFATPEGARLFWSFRLAGEWLMAVSPRVPSMEQYLGLRHRLMEAALDTHAPDRIVELGAGLSRRGVTWAGRGVPYVEIDLPHMAAAKRALLARRAPAALLEGLGERLAIVDGDILDPAFGDRLAGHLAGARRPAVVAEGVVGYFDRGERRRILSAVSGALASAGHGIFLCDVRTRAAVRAVGPAMAALRAGIRIATGGRGARPDFEDDDDVRRTLLSAGFTQADKMDASQLPDLAHLSFPIAVWRAHRGGLVSS